MQTISQGNKVKHRTDYSYNNHPMEVQDVDGDKVSCLYYDRDGNSQEKEFDINEIQFLNEGFKPYFDDK